MTSLQQFYPELRPWERIRLLLAAHERQDEVEYQRLFDASAIRPWYFSEHLLAEQALHVLTLTYITEQLDAVASLFLALTQLAIHAPQEQDWELMAEGSAYSFSINAEGWKMFCAAHHFPAESLVAQNHPGWVLSYCEQYVPTLASPPEELNRFHPSPLLTASAVAQRWQSRLAEMVTSTPLDTTEYAS